MISIKTLNVNGINLEYVQNDDDVYILNTKNKRYIMANNDMIDFFKCYNDCSEKNIDIENYLYKNKTDIFNIKILNFKIKSSVLNKGMSILNFFFNKYTFIISLFSLVFIPKIVMAVQSISIQDINIKNTIIIYLAQLLIIFLHELGHYQEYSKKCNREYSYFGVGLRYFCLILFYIDVSFLNTLNKDNKIKIILSGVRNQFIINAILASIYMITNSQIVLYIMIVNWVIMITNSLPFMKLDGFWFINTLLNTENYMNDFITSIKTKSKVKPVIAILSILNLIIIGCVFIATVFGVINMIA